MSYTLETLENKLSEIIGDTVGGDLVCTASADGAADGSTLISSDLLIAPTAHYVMRECEITSGAKPPKEDRRLIREFGVSGSTATLTPYNVFGGQVLNTVTFRLHRILLNYKYQGLNEALRQLSIMLPNIIREDLITGELLRNSHLDFWRSNALPYDWVKVAGTVAKESIIVYEGTHSLSLTGASGDVEQLIPLSKELVGVTLTFEGYAYGTADASILLRISHGATNSDSAALSLTNTWEKLTATLTISDATQPIKVHLMNGTAVAAKFDALRLYVPTSNRVHWLPYSSIYRNLTNVLIGHRADVAKSLVDDFVDHPMPEYFEGGYAFYPGARGKVYPYPELINQGAGGILPNPYYVRLIGIGKYPTITIATGETALLVELDVDEEEAELIATKAGILAIEKAINSEYLSDKDHWRDVLNILNPRLVDLHRTAGRARPNTRITPWNAR